MFSKRGIRADGDFEKQRLREHEYVQRRLSELTDRGALEAAICQWWNESLPIMKSALDGKSESNVSYSFASEVGESLPRPSQYILDAGVQISLELATAIDWVIGLASEDIRVHTDESGVAWYVLAEATAPLVAREKDVLVFQLFHRMCTNRSKEMSPFDDVFIRECAEPENRDYWLSELSRPANLSAFSDGWTSKPSPGQYEGPLTEWQANTNPFVLLSGWRNMVEFEGFPFTRLDYLCRLNQARWLDAVEDLPLPEMQYQALMSRFEDEPECIISSLEVADCVFDGGGGWNRKAVAIHTLRIAEAYVDALYTSRARAVGEEGGRGGKSASLSEDESLRELVDGEISRWLERMFATLVARNDGRTLAVELAAHFLVKYLRLLDETRGPKIVHLTERCFDIAIRTLISSGVTPEFAVAQGKRHVAWENELARYGCAFRAHGLHFVLVGMQIIDETTSGHGPFGNQMPGKAVAPLSPSFRMLWEPMIELLVQGDQMPSLLLTGSHFKGRQAACHQLGRVLGSLEEPVNGLEQAWRALQGKRTEAIERRNDRSDADAAPKFLVLIGIGAVSALIESKRDYPYHKFERLWNVLLKSTQSMILMQVFDFSLPWKGIYAYAIALLGIQYPAGDPILDQAVSFVSNDHELLRSVKAMLEANGWDSSAVSELLARNGVA